MKIIKNPERTAWPVLCQRPEVELEFLESTIQNILNRVKKSGDEALKEFTRLYDKATITTLAVSEAEVNDAIQLVSAELKKSIQLAADNIRKFHAAQKREVTPIETTPGVLCWRVGNGIEKVGIYIPGGSAPLFSTVLMLGVPASLAGCKEVVLCTPPDATGKVNSAILYAANLVGIKKIFKVGGAQAIAAMAFGTESIPKVYKIFGPGNQYVTKAKQMVNQQGTAIDMPAGPSEVLVYSNNTTIPAFAAADLLSQAEHGADSQVVLVGTDEQVLSQIMTEVTQQVATLPRKELAEAALNNSRAILFDREDTLIDFINEYAPEHLIFNFENAEAAAEKIINAGSIFIGPYTPESAGDYASGTNHTLPTNGFAKAYGGVSLESFMKYTTVQKITKQGIQNLGPAVIAMAEAEQLNGHAEAVRIRMKNA